jgi:FMN-dependent NADH-azoreductase
VPKKLKQYITTINRQGERFSTNFTKEGLTLLKTLPKSDIEDLVSVSGNEYFSKIKYEF